MLIQIELRSLTWTYTFLRFKDKIEQHSKKSGYDKGKKHKVGLFLYFFIIFFLRFAK